MERVDEEGRRGRCMKREEGREKKRTERERTEGWRETFMTYHTVCDMFRHFSSYILKAFI